MPSSEGPMQSCAFHPESINRRSIFSSQRSQPSLWPAAGELLAGPELADPPCRLFKNWHDPLCLDATLLDGLTSAHLGDPPGGAPNAKAGEGGWSSRKRRPEGAPSQLSFLYLLKRANSGLFSA